MGLPWVELVVLSEIVSNSHLGKGASMQLGMIGLGRMGANMVRRLIRAGHECVVYDRSPDVVQGLEREGAKGSKSFDDFAKKLATPRAAWMMLPAAIVDGTIRELTPHLNRDDIIVDGGNSY